MPNSFSQKTPLTCPQMNKPFEFEVWLIVDRDERPDLIERIRAGSLHTVVSPYTGDAIGEVNAPLLIFQPNHTPPLLFSPAQQTTQVQNQQQAMSLIQQLQQNVGIRWQDGWLADGLSGAERQMLPVVLRGNPEAEIRAIVNDLQQPPQDMRDMSRRAEMCRRALALLPKQGNEVLWAALQFKLGNALCQNPLEDRAQNLEDAIRAYEAALTVRTRDKMPVEWAITTMNLGIAYVDRIKGDKADNLEDAIRAYEAALTVRTRDKMPVEWATTMMNLGNAYRNRIKWDKADNLEDAIRAYEAALTVLTRDKMPVEWAITTMNLGAAYADRIKGDKADNLEDAIRAFEAALTVLTRDKMPVEWATTTMNLGAAYADRIKGDKADNLEDAIRAYEATLTVLTRDKMPVDWAQATMNLGNAYVDRIKGDKADNLEDAIRAYEAALTVLMRDKMPVEWATTTMNLGAAYRNRIKGNKADNLEDAIRAYEAALTVLTRDKMPVEWATTMMNLGAAYADRIKGDKADNLEDAIRAYEAALTVRTRDKMPVEWATTMMNLGAAYADRIKGDKADNLEDAIRAYEAALTVLTRDKMPVDWAQATMNLGNAYVDRIKWDKADNLEDAIRAYEAALTVLTRDKMPVEWATTTMNLGAAYADRIKGNKADNLEDAIRAYEAALTVRKRAAFPVEHRDTLKNLAFLYFGERRWSEAHQTCGDAIAVGADIFAAGIGDAGRMDAIKQTGDLFTRAAYSAIQLSRYGEALTLLEAGKARLLAEAQSLSNANLYSLTDDERGQVQTLRDKIKALEYEYRLPTDNPSRRVEQTITAELGKRRAALRGLIEAFREKYPDFMPEGLALDAMLALIPADGAIVAPLFTSQGSAVFIVPGGVQEVTAQHVLLLDDFRLEDVNELTRGPADDPEWGGWLGAYFTFKHNGNAKTLFDGIADVTRRLWDAFMGRVHERLHTLGVRGVLLMPQGYTNLFPLHAAWREVDGSRRYFMDDFTVSYTPSMVTLATARRRTAPGTSALVAGVSQYTTMNNLPNTRTEAESIAALFGTSALLDGKASVDAVREGVRGKAYVHLSSHGGFGWGGDAFASALYLGNDEALPLPQIMATLALDAARLVVLSACETGIVDFHNVPDEFVGLPAAFMQAGAGAVVSSLWTVEDRSTALLMEKMYKLMFDPEHPCEPVEALRQAQFWLRDVTAGEIGTYYQAHLMPRMAQSEAATAYIELLKRAQPNEKPYAHPFYWAAFTYSGL